MLGGETILDGETKEIKVVGLRKQKRQSKTLPDKSFSPFFFKELLLLSLSLSLSLSDDLIFHFVEIINISVKNCQVFSSY